MQIELGKIELHSIWIHIVKQRSKVLTSSQTDLTRSNLTTPNAQCRLIRTDTHRTLPNLINQIIWSWLDSSAGIIGGILIAPTAQNKYKYKYSHMWRTKKRIKRMQLAWVNLSNNWNTSIRMMNVQQAVGFLSSSGLHQPLEAQPEPFIVHNGPPPERGLESLCSLPVNRQKLCSIYWPAGVRRWGVKVSRDKRVYRSRG